MCKHVEESIRLLRILRQQKKSGMLQKISEIEERKFLWKLSSCGKFANIFYFFLSAIVGLQMVDISDNNPTTNSHQPPLPHTLQIYSDSYPVKRTDGMVLFFNSAPFWLLTGRQYCKEEPKQADILLPCDNNNNKSFRGSRWRKFTTLRTAVMMTRTRTNWREKENFYNVMLSLTTQSEDDDDNGRASVTQDRTRRQDQRRT